MRALCRSLRWAALSAGLLLACQPRNIIPKPSGAGSTMTSACAKLPNCGQCVSDARCGFCVGANRCIASETAATCESGWIAKDPEQSLCPADKSMSPIAP